MKLNTIEIPFGLDASEAELLLNSSAGETNLSKRLDRFSELLRGRAYVEGSLGGGPQSPEEFRVSLNAFDCVTFIETVMALALSGTIAQFIEVTRRIRYHKGKVDWFSRNHYMVDWSSNNVASRFVSNLTSGPLSMGKVCTLNLIQGLPSRTTTFRYFPTQHRQRVAELFETGDLLLFASTKETLDVFHMGLLIEREGDWILRHATRTGGAVIDEELVEFIDRNEMAGFILLRPLCVR